MPRARRTSSVASSADASDSEISRAICSLIDRSLALLADRPFALLYQTLPQVAHLPEIKSACGSPRLNDRGQKVLQVVSDALYKHAERLQLESVVETSLQWLHDLAPPAEDLLTKIIDGSIQLANTSSNPHELSKLSQKARKAAARALKAGPDLSPLQRAHIDIPSSVDDAIFLRQGIEHGWWSLRKL
jgi:hypothetical protein